MKASLLDCYVNNLDMFKFQSNPKCGWKITPSFYFGLGTLAMELAPKCNSFREIGLINLKFISFENSWSQFLNARLVLLGLVKFVVKITTSFFRFFSFYHNYLILIFKIYNQGPNIFWFDNCEKFLQNKTFDLFPSYLGPYLLVPSSPH
jgi:hypothetical protein